MDGNTQVVVLGTGDSWYEEAFRSYENQYKGSFCAYIAYDENVAHNIYSGCDALLVPSRFELMWTNTIDCYEIWCDSNCQRDRRT